MGNLPSQRARVTRWLASICTSQHACCFYPCYPSHSSPLPTLSSLTHSLAHSLCSFSFPSHTNPHTETDTDDLHGTPCPSCQCESVMWRKSAYFVSSRSNAEPLGSLNRHLTASWLLPLWRWRLHLLTFSVCLQAKFNPRLAAAR